MCLGEWLEGLGSLGGMGITRQVEAKIPNFVTKLHHTSIHTRTSYHPRRPTHPPAPLPTPFPTPFPTPQTHLVCGEGLDAVLQLGQLLEHVGRQHVRPDGGGGVRGKRGEGEGGSGGEAEGHADGGWPDPCAHTLNTHAHKPRFSLVSFSLGW